MLKPFLHTILFTFFSFVSFAQIKISGTVSDANKNPIPFGYVIALEQGKGVTTDENGQYEIQLPTSDKIQLKFTHTGFQDSIVTIKNPKPNVQLDIQMKTLRLKEVTVKGKRNQTDPMQQLDAKNISKVPAATGDFLNATLSTQMGVAINNELSASYSVRGGSYDENLVYVNGIEVYRPFLVRAGEQEGLSFINSDLVQSIEFSAGGFPVRFGDKMSSVLDIQYKKPKSFEAGYNASLLGASAYIGTASKNGKLSQITGVRYRSNQYLLGSLDTDGEYVPRFGDIQSYWSWQATQKSSFSFLGQISSNLYRFFPQTRETEFGGIQQALRLTIFFDGSEQSSFLSGTQALEWNYQGSDRWHLKTFASRFQTREKEEFDIIGQYFLDEVEKDINSENFNEAKRNLGVGGFLNHARNRVDANVTTFGFINTISHGRHLIKIGGDYRRENIEDRIKEWVYLDSADYSLPNSDERVEVFSLINAKNDFSSNRISAFVEDKMKFQTASENEWEVNLGIRGQHYTYTNSTMISPRGYLAYIPKWKKSLNDTTLINKQIVIRLAGGVYYQAPFYRELKKLNGFVNPNIKSQQSTHVVLGADYPLFIWGRPFILKGEAYYKWMRDLIPYEIENIRLRYHGTNNSKGFARGIDLKLNGEFVSGIESWATLSVMQTQEDILNDRDVTYFNEAGEPIYAFTNDKTVTDSVVSFPGYIPRPTDQRVQFGLFFRDEMPNNPSVKVQLSLIFGSGLPFGPPTFERHKDVLRTRSYRRVDIGFSKDLITGKTKNWGIFKPFKEAWVSLEIFNLLQVENVVNYQWIRDVNGSQYSVPNFLTSRRVNIRLVGRF